MPEPVVQPPAVIPAAAAPAVKMPPSRSAEEMQLEQIAKLIPEAVATPLPIQPMAAKDINAVPSIKVTQTVYKLSAAKLTAEGIQFSRMGEPAAALESFEHSCHYMQRHGWHKGMMLPLISYGVNIPEIKGWPNFHIMAQPYDAQSSLLARLFLKRPRVRLKSRILAKRQKRQKAFGLAKAASFAALAVSFLVWINALSQLHRLNQTNAELQSQISILPPAMPINGEDTYKALALPNRVLATLQTLPLLPLQSFTLKLSPPDKAPAATLRLLTQKLSPEDSNILPHLANWQTMQESDNRQGSLSDSEPQIHTYQLSYKP